MRTIGMDKFDDRCPICPGSDYCGAAHGNCSPHIELTISTDPADFGATHRLVFDDGTEELLRIDGWAVLERL